MNRDPIVDDKEANLIRKLEEKTLQLEETNRELQRDIAERQQAQEALRESEERFRATFEQAAVGIAHVELDGRFLRLNEKLCEITGYAHAELLGLPFHDLTVPEEQADGTESRLALLAGRQNSFTAERRYRRKDGRVLWVNVATTLLRDAAGGPKYFIAVIADISGRKALEEQLFRAQRMESIGALAGGIAHDLNNMLAPITMGVSLIKQTVVDPESIRIIDMIERSAQRGTNLVRQVLSFARGQDEARLPVKLRKLVDEFAAIAATTFPKNIAVQVEIPDDIWSVPGNPTQLDQVLLNLGVNARDAMPHGGTLRLAARNLTIDRQHAVMNRTIPPGRYVVLSVTDTGIGMAPDILAKVFEPFFSTKASSAGTGLGLSTTLAIVRSHGGFIDVRSTPGVGTTFDLYLSAEMGITGAVSAPLAVSELPRGNGELILVVDDESSILTITRQTLETFGYRVLTAVDGAQAIGLFALNRSEVAVVITDLLMPVMDGVGLTAALRRLDPAARIIAASGLNASNGPERLARAGIQHFLAKPYTAEAMLTLLRKALHPPGSPEKQAVPSAP